MTFNNMEVLNKLALQHYSVKSNKNENGNEDNNSNSDSKNSDESKEYTSSNEDKQKSICCNTPPHQMFSRWSVGTIDEGPIPEIEQAISRNCLTPIRNSPLVTSHQVIEGVGKTFTADLMTLSSLTNMGTEGEQCSHVVSDTGRSTYKDRLLHNPSPGLEVVLASTCDAVGFDIAEVWLRTGPKSHQLVASNLRPAALENSVRTKLVDIYYGERSPERTHRLSPALCKKAKEANDVVWVTTHTEIGAETLKKSLSDVQTAVAIPVCHTLTKTNMTFIFFSMKRSVMHLATVEFLVHMALAAAVTAVNTMEEDVFLDKRAAKTSHIHSPNTYFDDTPHRVARRRSVTGMDLEVDWGELENVEYLTDGGNSWIHSAVIHGRPCVVKTLKPECQDVVLAINEIEDELEIHSQLDHPNIVALYGAGVTSKGVRFVILERLDGGTLTQLLGYNTRIRDRRRRFRFRKQRSYKESLTHARNIALALKYLHEDAVPGGICLHRDLKPDNIGFALDGSVKIIDFGLAKIVTNASAASNDVYMMSGETGSLRYMAPEVADCRSYNHKVDVYSFGIILWEMLAGKRPYEGMTRDTFFLRVVRGGERPSIPKKWPAKLSNLIQECWSNDIETRPNFSDIVKRIDDLHQNETKVGVKKKIVDLIDRHSTWF